MPHASRRGFLIGSGSLPAAAVAGGVPQTDIDRVAADLRTYIDFGNKQAGGAGDEACGTWLERELKQAGFAVERQGFTAPWFEARTCELLSGTAKATVWPQPIVVPTGPGGVTGPLVHVDAAGQADGSLAGAIALVDLPYGRLSSAVAKPIRTPIAAALAAGARAVVAITNGPTGKIIALNADGRTPMFSGPVALIAPEDAAPFRAAGRVGDRRPTAATGSRSEPIRCSGSRPRSTWRSARPTVIAFLSGPTVRSLSNSGRTRSTRRTPRSATTRSGSWSAPVPAGSR